MNRVTVKGGDNLTISNGAIHMEVKNMTVGEYITFNDYPSFEIYRNDDYNWVVTVNRTTHWCDSARSVVKYILSNA